MTIQQNSPGNNTIYKPLLVFALLLLHSLLVWAVSKDFIDAPISFAILSIGVLISLHFNRVSKDSPMSWRPLNLLGAILISWIIWFIFQLFADMVPFQTVTFVLISYWITLHSEQSHQRKRKARDIGV